MLSFQEVRDLSRQYNVIPVSKKLFAGTETPLGIYQKLCDQKPNTFLLESAEQGVWGRYSFIGVKSRGQLIATEDSVDWISDHSALPEGQLPKQPLDALEALQSAWHSAPVDFPLSSGLVGFI